MQHGTTISLQKKLTEEVDRIIKERPDLFYRSRSDFVADAIRRRVAALAMEAKQ
jgi:metal-responsive CopG/Arc/MetJ family transcriptional regulator